MAGFRDDREALLARLEALEGELARVGGDEQRAALRQRVEELSAAVHATTDRIDRDRGALSDLAARLDSIRSDLVGKDEPAPAPAAAPPDTSQPVAAAHPPARVARFPFWMLLAAGALIAIAYVLVSVPKARSRSDAEPTESLEPKPESVANVHAFDPLAGLPRARALSPLGSRGRLSSIRAHYVSSSGLVDLLAGSYQGSVQYEFAEPGDRPPVDPAAPIGVDRPVALGRFATVHVSADGYQAGSATPFPFFGTPPAPACTFADVWLVARARGAPGGAVADIEYARRGDQGGWSFTIAGTDTNLQLTDDECVEASHAPAAPAAADGGP